jgi:fructose-1,6-bisphosphatase/sedoheptulose 1,7-bisphosphatase-like protein
MGDVLDEAYAIAQCKDCPWYKSCVSPMKFTAEDIRRQLQSSVPGMSGSPEADLGMQNLLASMATAAQNSLLEACPIFINRLRANPKLAQHLKEMMQNWGQEEELDTL